MERHHPCEHVLSAKYDQKRPPNLYIQQPTVHLLCVDEELYLCKSKHRLFGWRNRTMPAQLWDRDSSMIRASVDICSLFLSYSSSRDAQPRHPSGSWRHGGASSSWLSRTTHALWLSIARIRKSLEFCDVIQQRKSHVIMPDDSSLVNSVGPDHSATKRLLHSCLVSFWLSAECIRGNRPNSRRAIDKGISTSVWRSPSSRPVLPTVISRPASRTTIRPSRRSFVCLTAEAEVNGYAKKVKSYGVSMVQLHR